MTFDKHVRQHGLTIKGIALAFDTHDEVLEIRGRGWVHFAQLVGEYTWDDLSRLLGEEMYGQRIIAVESVVAKGRPNQKFGILLEEKLW